MKIIYYPILIFAFNRPNLLNNLLKSVRQNLNYNKHNFYFFCDGPKELHKKNQIRKIKENISIIKKFKSSKKAIIIRKKNYGLANNIIDGVSQVLKKNDACIVLEDDLILHSDCLKFINFGLNKFKNDKSIGSISGYSYIHSDNLNCSQNWFKHYRHCSWSWGTWSSVWKKCSWDFSKFSETKLNFISRQRKFVKAGNDIPLLLNAHVKKLIDSWAVRFNYNCLKKGLYSISPKYSLVKNDGFGINATHTVNFFKRKKITFNKLTNIDLNFLKKPKIHKELNKIIKLQHGENKKLVLKILMFKYLKFFF